MKPQADATEGVPKKRRTGSLRVGAALALGGAMLVLIVVFVCIITQLLVHYFGALQDQIISSHVQRLASVLEQAAMAKIRLVRNNAEWDDTWEFVHGKAPQYLEKNYAPEVNSSGQDVAIVFSKDRRLLGILQSRPGDQLRGAPKGLDVAALAASSLLGPEAASGVIRTDFGVLLLASCPIKPTDLSQPADGWLILGTYLDEDRLGDIEDMSGMKLSVSRKPVVPPRSGEVAFTIDKHLFGSIAVSFPSAVKQGASGDRLGIHLQFASLVPGSPILLKATTEVSIYRDAVWTRNWIIVLSIIGGLTLMAVSMIAGEIVVMRPLSEIDRQIELLSQEESREVLLSPRRNDEIGRLALSANRFLQRALDRQREAERQKQLIDSILDSANEGIEAYESVRNTEGEIEDFRMVLMNREAERICHQGKGEFLGLKMCECFPKTRSSGIFARYVRVANSREPESFEIYYEGHRITAWLRFSVAPWGDGVVVTFEDITQRKAHEGNLSESYAEIERFNLAMIGREERIIEIKQEVNELRARLGLPPIYGSSRDET
ncbi:hypothetical protein BH09VER1_BH09VER1_49800 [soil metagenome]